MFGKFTSVISCYGLDVFFLKTSTVWWPFLLPPLRSFLVWVSVAFVFSYESIYFTLRRPSRCHWLGNSPLSALETIGTFQVYPILTPSILSLNLYGWQLRSFIISANICAILANIVPSYRLFC